MLSDQLFYKRFLAHWNEFFHPNIKGEDRWIVAISGGADSVVLAFLLKSLGVEIHLAHCNFHLRGEESDRDETFVKNLALQWNLNIQVKSFDTEQYAKENKLSIEEAARNLRYEWFRELASRNNANSPSSNPIFVAHHANDHIETMLNNFFRGTGIAGLQGIQSINNGIYRPLLFAKRTEIIQFALFNNLQWVEDSTNKSSDYTRNYLRNEVLLGLKDFYPTIEDNLLGNIKRFEDLQFIYNNYIEKALNTILVEYKNGFKISIVELQTIQPQETIIYEIAKRFGFNARQTIEWQKLLSGESGSFIVSDKWKVWKDRVELLIFPLADTDMNLYEIKSENNTIQLSEYIISFIVLDAFPTKLSTDSLYFDLDKISFPLQLRHWQEGDEFYPSGMSGKKKLAKYFIDQKISVAEKHQIWLLTKENKILTIIGKRTDRRFLANATSRNILKVKLENNKK